MNNRSDYFSLSGRTFKEFRNEVNRFEKNLVFRRVKMGEIYFSIMPKKPGTGTEGIPMTQKNWDLYCETFETGAEFKPETEDFGDLYEEDPELFEENRVRSRLFLTVGGEHLFVSGDAQATIGSRLGQGGTDYNIPGLARNMAIACHLREMPEKTAVTLVMLKRDDQNGESLNGMKLLAMPSGGYVHIPLSWVPAIAIRLAKERTLGRPRVTGWTIDQKRILFEMEFPEYAEQLKEEYGFKELLIPGVRIETSPVTRSSFEVIGTLRPERGYAIDDSCEKLTHRGHVDIDDYMEKVGKTILLGVRKTSEELAKKLGRELTESTDAGERREAYARAILAGIEGLHLASPRVLGERRTKEIREGLIEEFNPDIPYTEYDIAVTFLHIAERVDPLSEEVKKALRSACKGAALINYRPSRITLLP